MTIDDAIKLTGLAAWPIVALIALFVLRPYIALVSRAAADLRALLDRSGEVVDLASQIAALSEATADIKAMQQVAQAARPEPPPTVGQPTSEQLWKQLETQWQQTRDQFRAAAQTAGVTVNFSGTVGVQNAAKSLVEKGAIQATTANSMADLSAQYQYMVRSTSYRAEALNENVVAAYTKTAGQVREALKSGA